MERKAPFDGYNAGYVQDLYERWTRSPGSVDREWQRIFAGWAAPAAPPGAVAEAPPPSAAQLRAALAAAALVDAYRLHGHAAARLDPLGREPDGHPMLDPSFHGITREELATVPASVLDWGGPDQTMADVLEWLRDTYTGTIGYEFEHLDDPERREWLRERIESGEHRRPLTREEQKKLLDRLTEVEAFEQFLHRAYLGQKRFSVEGNDMVVPMLDLAIEQAAGGGAREVVLGMAHRGRLNVLTHVLGRPYASIIAEFEKHHAGAGTTGDVKYHLGAEGTYATASGEPLGVTLAPNPSHLEFVNPVVEGMARAKQVRREGRAIAFEPQRVLPVLLHGDAAFAGQGVVAETLNLAELNGYRTGGTLHIIVNNQIGFTTDPGEGRSTDYASDLARGFDLPIFHVNADDPEACLAVVRLALAYRERFHADVVIDLVGYRRYGHNEGDEPGYTQPRLYRRIEEHPTVRTLWADRLVERGNVSREEVDALWKAAYDRLVKTQEEVRAAARGPNGANPARQGPPPPEPPTLEPPVETAVPAERLAELDRELHSWPEGFTVHPKLVRALERRARAVPAGGPLDWAHAEALAFASLLVDGKPIRLTGQDAERGTFSQRHLVLHDVETGERYAPLGHLSAATAPLEVYNSPLSEIGALGFEYGYSTAVPHALVLWEAQFGDFANVAQVIIDQFIASGRAKWGQLSRLVLLLPHGYEGQGPEHSSARLERFLQLAAEDNLRVANCTTPAQYFHLLRRQALLEERRPLVVMTPKSLLRHPRAVSRVDELSEGRFHMVLDDPDARDRRDRVTRVVLCTGKVYYDLIARREALAKEGKEPDRVAIVRVELLYPFPESELVETLAAYEGARELLWVQEEPENMGAWRYVEPRLRAIAGRDLDLGYVGRPERASPAEGYAITHEYQQTRIVEDAFAAPAAPPRRPRTVQKTR